MYFSCNILIGNPEGTRNSVAPRHKCEDSIKK